MIYAMADVHGEYEKYMEMLELIDFSEEDELFMLGDAVDRGPQPIELLKDMMLRSNVFPLMGNHEFMMLQVLKRFLVEITEENADSHLTAADMQSLMYWQQDGGAVTLEAFRKLPREQQLDVMDYVLTFSLYETVNAGGRDFILVHAGLGNFSPEKELPDYTLEEVTMMRPDPYRNYFTDDTRIICGHTPTLIFSGKAEILHGPNQSVIDCGAPFPKGRLACLRLDDMKEFYI